MNRSTLADFAAYLGALPPRIAFEGETKSTIINLLVNCWPSLTGSSDQSTTADKIYRAESLAWESPILRFILERHGCTVNGSKRAELHHWEVNTLSGIASIAKKGIRQLEKNDPRMNVAAKALETALLIQSNSNHKSLKWIEPDMHVIVQIGSVIPETNQRTTASRRKRYRGYLDEIMLTQGWVRSDQGNKIGFRKSHQ